MAGGTEPIDKPPSLCSVLLRNRLLSQVDPSGPLATLRKLLLSEESIASFKKWVSDNWYFVVLIGVVSLIILVRIPFTSNFIFVEAYLLIYFYSFSTTPSGGCCLRVIFFLTLVLFLDQFLLVTACYFFLFLLFLRVCAMITAKPSPRRSAG